MKISVILAHPDKKSLNHAIAKTAVRVLGASGHRVFYHDLYGEKFDPLLKSSERSDTAKLPSAIAKHCRELASADGIVIIHPNWWGQPPAILKGWIDRVIRPGVAYRFEDGDKGEGVPVGLLKAKAVLIFNTSNTGEKREREIFGDPLELIWKKCVFDLCGVRNVARKMFRIVVTSTAKQRERWLAEVEDMIRNYFPHSS